jgi:hypothetical protein
MVPRVPPLNARNPAIRIMPPRPVSYREMNYVSNERRPKREREKLKYVTNFCIRKLWQCSSHGFVQCYELDVDFCIATSSVLQ